MTIKERATSEEGAVAEADRRRCRPARKMVAGTCWGRLLARPTKAGKDSQIGTRRACPTCGLGGVA